MLNQYEQFVAEVTSDESNELSCLIHRLEKLGPSCNVSLLLTGAIGMAAEAAELMEVMDDEDIDEFHMKRELGDVLWYWSNACRALNLDAEEMFTKVEPLSVQCTAPNLAMDVGDFAENVKKMIFQGKPIDRKALWTALAVIIWDINNFCDYANTSLEEIVDLNIEKLQSRYPGGKFSIQHSENRKEGDI